MYKRGIVQVRTQSPVVDLCAVSVNSSHQFNAFAKVMENVIDDM